MAMIYGANASGKSNLLHAIQTMWRLMFSPQREEHVEINYYLPFATCKGNSTQMETIFFANNRCYNYVLEYDDKEIKYEKMLYTTDNGVLSLMFERKKGEPVKFGGTLGLKIKEREMLLSETFDNHTLLSTFNKKKIDIPLMNELYEWIKEKVHELNVYNDGMKLLNNQKVIHF